MRRLFWIVLLLLPSLSFALAPPKGATEVTSVEGITEYRLDNGLRVLLFPDATKPTVTVNITYLVGSRHENYGETGMAHLLEHLLFKGTPDNADIPGEMKKRGIGYNATTWVDRTNYFASFTADDGTLDWLLALEADRMINSHVRRSDLDSEMTVVRNEMEAGENNPVRVLMARIASSAYLWHNYGNSTIGARADVEKMPIERLQKFYADHYRPDNAVLLVAGRIDPVRTLSKIVETFGPLKRPAAALQATYTRDPVQDGEREVTVRRPGETAYLGAAYHIPAGAHPDAAALEVLAGILGDTPLGRLHKKLAMETKQATYVGQVNFQLAEPGTLLFLAVPPKDGDIDALRDSMLAEVETRKAAFTEDELAAIRTGILKDIELTTNDANRLAMALSESIALGDWRLFFLQRDRIEKVTLADVQRVADAYLKPANRTLGRFLPTEKPDRAEIPEAEPVAKQLEGYTGRAAVAAGEAFDPSPANIDARTQTAKLSNGTGLALLPKENRGDTVVLAATFRFAKVEELTGMSEAAGFVPSMLTRGAGDLTREQIARRLDELKAQFGFFGGPQSVGFSLTTTRENLPAAVDLIALMLKSPTFPENEFEQLRSQSITSVESSMTEPQAIAGNAMGRHFNPWPKGHPYYNETFEESLASLRALTLAQVKDFHREFYGAGFGEIAVVGDFDVDAFKAQAEKHFGGWTTKHAFVRLPDPAVEVATADASFQTPDKANAVIMMRTDLPLSDTHPDYVALSAASYVLGGGTMKSRLADRVRQKEGLSYSVGAQFAADALDDNATLMAYAIAAPENIAKVEAAIREEVRKLLDSGLEADELKDAVDGLLKARQRNRGEDGALVGALRENLYLGRRFDFAAGIDAQYAALTPEHVHEAFKRHFGLRPLSVFKAGDFEKAGKAASE